MAVKIGSARSDERGGLNGAVGDQKNGKEVSTQSWYLHKKGWVIIRLRDPEKAEKNAHAAQAACDNQHFGYGQSKRLTGYNAAKAVGFDPALVKINVNIDCSELVRMCLAYAGIMVPDWSTASMIAICRSMPKVFEIIEGEKAQTDKYLSRGDILVTKTKGHTVVVLSDGSLAEPRCVSVKKVYPDISHHHPVKDWDALAKAAPFLISKATQGTKFVDPSLDTFIEKCEEMKIPYWLYTFLDKGSEVAQAKFLVATCKGKVGSYFRGYCLDAEQDNPVVSLRKALKWLSDESPRIMLYTGYKDAKKYEDLTDRLPKNCAWWQARYGKNDGTYYPSYPPSEGVDLHQFTDKGTCPGITDKIDLNRLTGTKPESWFTEKAADKNGKTGFTGTYPSLENGRKDTDGFGWYELGDGITTLKNYPTQIRRVQTLLNWVNGGDIDVDGQFGKNTKAACELAQTNLKIPVTGKFDHVILEAARACKK